MCNHKVASELFTYENFFLRLSRKQLPAVEANGLIRYSTPIGESELEWLSLGSSSEQNLYNSQPQQRIGSTSGSDMGYWQRNDRFKGTAGRRGLEIHSACDIGWSRSKNFKVFKKFVPRHKNIGSMHNGDCFYFQYYFLLFLIHSIRIS